MFPKPGDARLFAATTSSQSLRLRALFELLAVNLTTACLSLSHEGITLRMTDSNARILIDVNLSASRFVDFQPRTIGFNLQHMKRVLRTVKKTDQPSFYIKAEHPLHLVVDVIPPADAAEAVPAYVTTSSITV